ncbi:sensor histidine kinase [Kineococcus rhizosphaerae]|uniref:histidine kinase n=1 Tax=Kineococcus rhizosphaerae TaxID=559628 RepID=A0A2T0R3T6_9ACTN|nr:histidine kinase [Kineococcus rhizosphaerae]PRY14695.1 signal transduction histidine kinase [Kineococcus rhizosphaerae]
MVARGVRPARRDVLVAAGTAAVTLSLLLLVPFLLAGEEPAAARTVPPVLSGRWSLLAVLFLVQAAALLAVRPAPRATVLAVAVLAAATTALGPQSLHGLGGPAVVVAVAVAVTRSSSSSSSRAVWRDWPVLVLAVLAIAGGELAAGTPAPAALVQGVALVGLPALGGLVVRSRRDVHRAVLGERDALVAAAVSRERTAMARELHDIAAHHLSGIALMAAVVDRQIDTDPARAHEGARQIRAQSTSVLDDLRRLVGLLREDVEAERSVESVATIADLVARSPRPVALRTQRREGFDLAHGVGPLAQLAVHRAVQEALSNAALHAPGADCCVEVDDRDPARLVVRVRNGAPAVRPERSSGGFGLRGMQERADLVGASLRYGPTPDGGWQVELGLERQELT